MPAPACVSLSVSMRSVLLGAVASLCTGLPALAGGSGENALLLVDPTSSEALWAANHYKVARDIPDCNVLYVDPGAASYPAFAGQNLDALFGTLVERGISDHIDYLVIMPGTSFYVSAPGLVSDSCAAVNRFGIAGAYTMAFISDRVLAGTSSSLSNRYWSGNNSVIAFDSETAWVGGQPGSAGQGKRYFISALLGYTGERGNTMAEILDMVDRSVAVDGTRPVGTTYFMHTGDALRSSPRHGFYPAIANAIINQGGNAVELFLDLPLGNHDCLGIMTGLAAPDIDGANLTLLPGSFADHLTSYAGRFDTSSQTKMSRWIAKGASGTSGTVEEPCNYAGKFPHARMHLYYYKGLSLGEAWFRSMQYVPFQNLLLGDPLTRPFTYFPLVDVPDFPTGIVSGTVLLHPTASATAPGAQIERLELLVDGVLTRGAVAGGTLAWQSELFADGWHELRVLAYDDSLVRAVGRFVGWVEADNLGRTATGTPNVTSGDQAQAFDFAVAAQGTGLVELRLVQNGRVLAATATNPDTLRVYGVNLGAGPATVQAEALFTDGSRVRGVPLVLDVVETGVGTSGLAPVAFDFHRAVPADGPSVIELPAVFDDALDSATFDVVTPPAQASLAAGASGGYRLLTPQPGAAGTDSLVYRVTTPSGVSGDATITLEYVPPTPTCSSPTTYCTSTPNSTGWGAVISSLGEPSISENDFSLYTGFAVPNQFGIYYYGSTQIQLPFGDGFRCVGAGSTGTYRLNPVEPADAAGDALRQLDFNEPPLASGPGAVLPGSTWYFQYWYRDPAGSGGSGFNLSNGLAVEFCP